MENQQLPDFMKYKDNYTSSGFIDKILKFPTPILWALSA